MELHFEVQFDVDNTFGVQSLSAECDRHWISLILEIKTEWVQVLDMLQRNSWSDLVNFLPSLFNPYVIDIADLLIVWTTQKHS